jgi:serine/threonine-protein kinase
VIADRYEVGEVIGRGGMAQVHAGTDRRLGRPVAIKLLLPEMAARPEIRTRFEAEARAAASLSHPNAVSVFDTGEHAGVPYIVMERLPGETLADRIAAQPAGRGGGAAGEASASPADVEWLRTVAVEVLGALGAAHAAGIVHRDVKPGNILIAADGRAKVADFGIAKSVQESDGGDLTTTGQLLGTPSYLAPERLDGAPASARSDLWALGVVLYEALAGAKPFAGASPLATARAVVAGTHRPLAELRPDVDPALVATVERAMATDPAARFASAAEMARALAPPAPGAPFADTVRVAGSGDTLVLDDRAGLSPAGAPAGPAGPAPIEAAHDRRRILAWAVIAGIVILVLFLLTRGGGDTGPAPSSASGPSPTTAPPTTAGGLASQLRNEAARLGGDDGPLAPALASRLRQLADQVDAGDGGGTATSLLATTVGWSRAGQVSPAAAAEVIRLLSQVPDVNPAVVNALTPTAPPATTPAPSGRDKGKGKGKDD